MRNARRKRRRVRNPASAAGGGTHTTSNRGRGGGKRHGQYAGARCNARRPARAARASLQKALKERRPAPPARSGAARGAVCLPRECAPSAASRGEMVERRLLGIPPWGGARCWVGGNVGVRPRQERDG